MLLLVKIFYYDCEYIIKQNLNYLINRILFLTLHRKITIINCYFYLVKCLTTRSKKKKHLQQ